MTEPFKSVLLVDFDSLHRSLTAAGGEAAARFSLKVPGWMGGLESGRLIGPEARTFQIKRCYADPKAIGEGRANFANAGFEVVDQPAAAHSTARSVDLMIAMDAMEQLAGDDDDAAIDEVVILSAEPTLAPLLTRLKGHGRRSVIYTDTHTAQTYRGVADAVLDIAAFAEFLLIHDAAESASALSVERSEIEAFARRIHGATSIPLFSPRTFAELFRLLTEEIVANGYHFQTTAKNVADRLSEAGRSVTRRQVVFIVKGLALKGHVFSTTDTPRKLAEVFREQARYLIENAGITLDEPQERILSAWLVDRAPTSLGRPAPSAQPAAPAPAPRPAAPATPRPAAAEAPAPAPGAKAPQSLAKVETLRPVPAGKPVEKPAASADRAATTPRETPAATAAPVMTTPARPSPPMISAEDARAAIAAKIAQSVRPKPIARPAAKSTAALAPPAPPPPAPGAAPPAPGREAADDVPQSLESSILAAIAQAVDVLVEDDNNQPAKPKKTASAPPPALRKRTPVPAVAGARSQPEPRPAAERPAAAPAADQQNGQARHPEGEDIGDEIQRIIATYNRNRKEEPPEA